MNNNIQCLRHNVYVVTVIYDALVLLDYYRNPFLALYDSHVFCTSFLKGHANYLTNEAQLTCHREKFWFS